MPGQPQELSGAHEMEVKAHVTIGANSPHQGRWWELFWREMLLHMRIEPTHRGGRPSAGRTK